MKWLLRHGGLVAKEFDAPDNRVDALEAALEKLGYELKVSTGPLDVRDRFRSWKCVDGTYDFVDHTGEICVTNLGNGKDEESAWEELERLAAMQESWPHC